MVTGAIHRRPTQYRAPTWSWASLDGPVRWEYRRHFDGCGYTMAYHASIDAVVCQPVSDAELTGRLKSAYAFLTGPLVPVQLVNFNTTFPLIAGVLL